MTSPRFTTPQLEIAVTGKGKHRIAKFRFDTIELATCRWWRSANSGTGAWVPTDYKNQPLLGNLPARLGPKGCETYAEGFGVAWRHADALVRDHLRKRLAALPGPTILTTEDVIHATQVSA